MVSKLNRRRAFIAIYILLIFIAFVGSYLVKHERDLADSNNTTYVPIDLLGMVQAHEWPIEELGENQTTVLYPNVSPRMGEKDAISLSWWPPPTVDGTTYGMDVYAFDTKALATHKYEAFESRWFRRPLGILFFLTRPETVFVPDSVDIQATSASQERFGCVDHYWGELDYTRCDYIAQYQHMILDVSVVINDAGETDAAFVTFEKVVQSAQAMIESNQNLP